MDRTAVIARADLGRLIEALRGHGYEVIGPTLEDGVIRYRSITSDEQLPVGLSDVQDGGTYRLEDREGEALFRYVVGPDSPKRDLFPPRETVFEVDLSDGARFVESHEEPRRIAFFGLRSCEIAAIAIQDRVLVEGPYQDPRYAARRRNVLIVAVDCANPGGTCFCSSMGTGPTAQQGFDLALTELTGGNEHRFLVRIGSSAGEVMLAELPHREATDGDVREAGEQAAAAAASMGRRLDTNGLEGDLAGSLESSRWDDIASRCLACGNCTLVCPTCFCVSVEDFASLDGASAGRFRRWDSCFSLDFSYIHGTHARSSIASRYRQWMVHKLSGWMEQFGTLGCVGCGRCITWCPVGIDITEEAAVLRSAEEVFL